jgi:hypothetical protein
MRWWKSTTAPVEGPVADGSERRRDPRIGGHFKVRYSGADAANKIVIGYGVITDLSRSGFGIEGARGLKRGMELALFLQMPDDDETICIPLVTVSWISGKRFGVQIQSDSRQPASWLDRLSEA